jgi:hypothetical protein
LRATIAQNHYLAAQHSVFVYDSKKAVTAAVRPILQAKITSLVSALRRISKPPDLRFEYLPRVLPRLLLAAIERPNRTKLRKQIMRLQHMRARGNLRSLRCRNFVVAIPNRPAPALRSHSLARGNVLTHSVIRTGLNADTLQPARSGQEYRSS